MWHVSLLTKAWEQWAILLIWIIFNPRITNYIHYTGRDKLGLYKISSHTLLGMWLLIHAEIEINPCKWKVPSR